MGLLFSSVLIHQLWNVYGVIIQLSVDSSVMKCVWGYYSAQCWFISYVFSSAISSSIEGKSLAIQLKLIHCFLKQLLIQCFKCCYSPQVNSLFIYYFQTFILPFIVIIQWDLFCTSSLTTASAPHRDLVSSSSSVSETEQTYASTVYGNSWQNECLQM